MPPIIFFLMTYKFGFAASESLTNLKLVEKGVPKSKVALLSVPMIPVKVSNQRLVSICSILPFSRF